MTGLGALASAFLPLLTARTHAQTRTHARENTHARTHTHTDTDTHIFKAFFDGDSASQQSCFQLLKNQTQTSEGARRPLDAKRHPRQSHGCKQH